MSDDIKDNKKQGRVTRLSVRARLILTGVLLVGMFLGAMAYSVYSMNKIGLELAGIAENDIPLTNVLTEVTTTQLEQAIHFERAVRFGQLLITNPELRRKYVGEVEKFTELNKHIEEVFVTSDALILKTIADARNELELTEFTSVQTQLTQIETEHADFAKDAFEVFDAFDAGESIEILEPMIENVEAEEDQLDKEVEDLLFEIENFTAQAALIAEEHEKDAVRVLLIVTGLLVVLAVLINWRTIVNITSSIDFLSKTIVKIRAGELTARTGLTGGDELKDLGRDLDVLLDERGKFMQSEDEHELLNESIMNILRTVSRLGNGDLTSEAPVAEDITGALGDAINQMTENVVEILSEVHQASDEVLSASDVVSQMATSSKHSVTKNSEAMNEIRNTIQETAKRIKRLGDRSQEINTIVKVISDISERTSVLALNANMQAAAAGEAGRGFMVVANEVQRLAESSQEATEQIGKLVVNIQTETGDTITTMDRGIEEVVKGSELTDAASLQMDQTLEKL